MGLERLHNQQPYHYMELACLLLEHAKDAFTGSNDYFKVGGTKLYTPMHWEALDR